MDFTFSAEQLQMRDTLAAFLADTCTLAQLRQELKSAVIFNPARWASLAGLGLFGMLVPEDQGGLGLAPQDFVLLAEACGYAALPEPLVCMSGAALPLLASCDLPAGAQVLDDALNHGAYVALSIAGTTRANHAARARAVLCVDGPNAALRPAGDAQALPGLDPFRALGFLPAATAQGRPDAQALARAIERGTVFAAAELLGLAQRAIDLAADYARERQQFGKPIGTNQAVKHLLANAQVKVSFARPVVYAASACCDDLTLPARARASHAKLAAATAALSATRAALQVHGAIGYSWEADVHILLKRAMALAEDWGSRHFHRARVAQRLTNLPFAPETLFPQPPSQEHHHA